MTLDKKITLCENLTPVEVRIGNYIMNLGPLITEVTRFLGTGFFWSFSYQAIPAIPAVLSYYRTRSYSSNNSSFLFYLEVISYHWREVNHYNLRHP